MAQTGYTPILIYSSSTVSQAPSASNLTNSTLGSELAINITDGKLFYKDNANNVQVIGWKTVPTSAGGTGLTSYAAGDLLYYASGTALTKLAIGANTTVLTSSGSAPQWTAQSSLSVGTATNLAGGLAGSVPYQTGAGATTFLGIGAANTVLTSSGSAPQWSTNLTIGSLTATSITNSGNITFNGTGQRFLADFTNGTQANRLIFQTSTANSVTAIQAMPSGTAQQSQWIAINGTDPANASGVQIRANATTAALTSYNTGTGASLPLQLIVGGVVSLSIDTTNKDVKIDTGNVIIGTSGKGIDFSATPGTGTSELLDDYEEGTWTPVLTFATAGNLSVAYSTQTGLYVKVGRLVTATCSVSTSTFTHTTASGDLRITGIPFTAATAHYSNLGFNGINKTNYTTVMPRTAASSGVVTFLASGMNQGASTVKAADMPTAGSVELNFTICYETDS